MEKQTCCMPPSIRQTETQVAEVGKGRADMRGIVWLRGGRTYLGVEQPLIQQDGEFRRSARLRPFGIDRCAVSNARFASFVDATAYVTDAENFGWSFVFKDALADDLRRGTQKAVEAPWWRRVDGAHWRCPAGPGSTIDEIADHPAVHISWRDAAAFAAWAGGRLLAEAEWEFAARAGRDVIFPWGNDEPDDSAPPCNIWQGSFPDNNHATDGYAGTAPVDSFDANPYGLSNMAGNVWEWCADPFRVRSLTTAGKKRDKAAHAAGEKVLKGGSFLCHRSYCHRYRIAARMGRSPDTSSAHIGFRIGYDRA